MAKIIYPEDCITTISLFSRRQRASYKCSFSSGRRRCHQGASPVEASSDLCRKFSACGADVVNRAGVGIIPTRTCVCSILGGFVIIGRKLLVMEDSELVGDFLAAL